MAYQKQKDAPPRAVGAPVSLVASYSSSRKLTLTARRAREAVRALNAIAAAASGVTGIARVGKSKAYTVRRLKMAKPSSSRGQLKLQTEVSKWTAELSATEITKTGSVPLTRRSAVLLPLGKAQDG